jgi:hypothetical protein
LGPLKRSGTPFAQNDTSSVLGDGRNDNSSVLGERNDNSSVLGE